MGLVQKSLVGQNVTTDPPIHEYMESVLISDAKAEFLQQNDLAGIHTSANCTSLMNMMTANIFPTHVNCNRRQYMQRYLMKLLEMKSTFSQQDFYG